MKRFLIFIMGVLLISTGCTDKDDELNGVEIRVKNVSSLNYDTVQVGGDDMVHNNVAPDTYSDYLVYESAYRYAYIAIKSGEDNFVLQPIDFVGETELPWGFYTYEIGLDAEGNVTLKFVID